MKKLIDIINEMQGNGFSFQKEVTIPWLNQKLQLTIILKHQTPSNCTITYRKDGGLIKFDKNPPHLTIKQVGIQTSLNGIDFNEKRAILQLSGFPDITYNFE